MAKFGFLKYYVVLWSRGNVLRSEGVHKGNSCMRVVGYGGAWRWNDIAKFFRNIETNGGPVGITGLDSFLVLAHGINLNVCAAVAYLVRALPGYDIFDGVALKSTKCNNVAAKKRLVFPADGVNINMVVNPSEHAFRDNGVDEMVLKTSCSTIPAGSEVFFSKCSWKHFVTVGIVDRCRMPSEFTHGEAVTSMPKDWCWFCQSRFLVDMY